MNYDAVWYIFFLTSVHRQQQSSNELAYQRRIRHLQSTSLLKNLSQSFPNLLDFGFGPPSSSSGGGPFSSASSQPSSSHGIIDPSAVNALSSNSENHVSLPIFNITLKVKLLPIL